MGTKVKVAVRVRPMNKRGKNDRLFAYLCQGPRTSQ